MPSLHHWQPSEPRTSIPSFAKKRQPPTDPELLQTNWSNPTRRQTLGPKHKSSILRREPNNSSQPKNDEETDKTRIDQTKGEQVELECC